MERHKLVKDMMEVMREVARGRGVYVQNRSAREFLTHTQRHPARGTGMTRVLKVREAARRPFGTGACFSGNQTAK